MGQGCYSKQPAAIEGTIRRPAYMEAPTLAAETAFTVSEVEALYELFGKLRTRTGTSVINDGMILKSEFQMSLFKSHTKSNFFVDRVFELFDSKKIGGIDFEAFVRNLSIFHPDARRDEKIAFAFKIYDAKGVGYIDRADIKTMLQSLFAQNDLKLTNEMIETILDQTFASAKPKNPNRIDKSEWTNMVLSQPSLIKNMTLPYLKDLTTTFPGFIFTTEQPDTGP